MPRCYMLIGLPGSGKSTVCEELLKDIPDIVVVSTDEYIEKYAKERGKKYEEVYREVGEDAQKWMNVRIRQLMNEKKNFIWDQTNVFKSARKKKISMLEQNKYEVVAVALYLSEEELGKRLSNRVAQGGKKISYKIIQDMKEAYELPTYDEKFKEIYLIGDTGAFHLVDKPIIMKNGKN